MDSLKLVVGFRFKDGTPSKGTVYYCIENWQKFYNSSPGCSDLYHGRNHLHLHVTIIYGHGI